MYEEKTLFVNVLLPIPVRNTFTYRVPRELNKNVFIGGRVIVPFGKSKLLTGIILSVHEKAPETYTAKYIEHVLDDIPIVTLEQLSFWKWISHYYLAPLGDVMNAALPANFKLASETKIVLHPDFNPVNKSSLKERELAIIETLEIKETLDLKEVSEIVGIKTIQPIIKKLIDKKIIITLEALKDRFIPKTASFYSILRRVFKSGKSQSTSCKV